MYRQEKETALLTNQVGIGNEILANRRPRKHFDGLDDRRPRPPHFRANAIKFNFGLVFQPFQIVDNAIAQIVVQRFWYQTGS